MDSDKYLEGQSMQRPPLFESDSFIYWKNRFETYVKSKDLDLWHVITNGDFQPLFKIRKPNLMRLRKISSDEECSTSGSEDEEYAMAVRDFKKFFKRRGGALDDSGDEDDEMICLGVDLEPDKWIKDSGCSRHMTGNRKLFSTYKAYNGGGERGGMGIMVTLIPQLKPRPNFGGFQLQSQVGGQSVMPYLHFGHAQHVSSADLSAWSTRASCPTSLKGPTLVVKKMDSHCGKRKFQTYEESDVFERYPELYARNVRTNVKEHNQTLKEDYQHMEQRALKEYGVGRQHLEVLLLVIQVPAPVTLKGFGKRGMGCLQYVDADNMISQRELRYLRMQTTDTIIQRLYVSMLS
ncbi:hypothetical protein Tco_0356568 [Tanacetum coccineum]